MFYRRCIVIALVIAAVGVCTTRAQGSNGVIGS